MATLTGLGQNSYVRYLKESSYGTAPTMSGAILLPALDGSAINPERERIKKDFVSGSRIMKKDALGRYINKFDLELLIAPTLLGDVLAWIHGAASSSGTGAYVHTYLCAVTGVRQGLSAAVQVAYGSSDSVDQVAGCTVTGYKITGSNNGDFKMTLHVVGKTASTVSRITTFSYPAVLDYNFSMLDIKVGAALGSVASVFATDMTLDVDLGYNTEEYFFGSATILQPQYNSIPKVTGSFKIDADTAYWADTLANTTKAAKFIWTSTDIADGSTPFSTTIEIPVLEYDQSTAKKVVSNDRQWMDIAFTARGGVTTGSPTTAIPFEIQHTDATATHT